eukprot:jgi/Mesvir1/18399/Mv14277-RA.1
MSEKPEDIFPWFEDRVTKSLNIKAERWQKFIGTDENRIALLDFIKDPDLPCIFIFENAKGELRASKHAAGKFKKKSLYFVRLKEEPLSNETINQDIQYGEFAEQPLEYLSAISQEVYLPLLCNPRNQDGWPEVVTKEVLDNLHKFIANIYVTIGQTKGKTLLPLPPTEGKEEKNLRDKDRIHVLESAVVTWTRQIKNVLKADPEAALKEGLNPGPLVELDFWQAKAANLNSIHEQLSGEKIQKVVKVLDLTKSTYYPAFTRLCREVAVGRLEANDDVRFLKPLKPYFERLNMGDDFPALVDLFKPMMHIILLIWKHSKYYNTAARLVILMREICNDLIRQACNYTNGEEIFKMEPQEAVDKLKLTLKVCGTFKSYYFDYKSRTATELPDNSWRFQNSALFARLDSFLERCHDILDLMQTIYQFNKLERIEIGGTKGKTLTASVRQIFSDFQQAVHRFQNVPYDIMDVESKQFDDNFYEFRCVVKELERRLGSIIIQAFDDCTTVGTTFKLLESFEGLLEREIIQGDLERKHIDLLRSYGEDLRDVQEIFNSRRENPVLNKNSAPHSGTVLWVRGLVARIEEPMQKLRQLNKVVMETEEAKDVTKLYTSLMASLTDYERTNVEAWSREIEATSEDKLKQPLLTRDAAENYPAIIDLSTKGESPFLKVNFDPMLVRLLREVKYFLLLGLEVPESALRIYKRAETFRQQTGNLDLVVNIYNKLLVSLLPVEMPLVEKKLENVVASLSKGLKTLSWNSHKIEDYITEVMSMVRELNTILQTIKSNVTKTIQTLDKWEANLMIERKEGKVYTTEDFQESHRVLTNTRYNDISDGGLEIQKFLSSSNKTLKVSKGAPAWKAYVDHVNRIVVDGLSKAILASIRYLYDQIEPETMIRNETSPLLEIRLELVAPDIVWNPDLGATKGGVRDVLNQWLKGFMLIGTLMKRLDIGDGNYLKELEEDYMVRDAISTVQGLVLANEAKCIEFKNTYLQFEYLWKRDLQATLAEFLATAEPGQEAPSLERFDAEISRYKAVQEEIHQLPATITIGWLRIDAKPIKQTLSTWATKWVFLYTHYLTNKVVNSVDELYDFMDRSNGTLDRDKEVGNDEESRGILYAVMGSMRDIRNRTDTTDAMFDPLMHTVTLLKKYGIAMPDTILKKLEEAPMQWEGIKKKMFQVRESVAGIQEAEAQQIRATSEEFRMKVDDFRQSFLKKAPFGVPADMLALEHVEEAYKLIDTFHHGAQGPPLLKYGSLMTILKEATELNESQDLFELVVVDYKDLKRCKEEMLLLKQLWDMISVVMDTFQSWRKTLWDKIDVDFLIEETKKLSKEIKQLNKAVRNWDSYKLLENAAKALLTSLPLVNDLHHPSMRERHWKQLMRATHVHFVMDDKFNLGDLLNLRLHDHVDSVNEIVDRAQKELIIEKALKKIDETWLNLTLGFVMYQDTEVMVLHVDDAVVEALENDQLQLQNMSAGKYVQGNPKFLEEVGRWQKKLGGVDTGLQTWVDVQKKWSALESIFVGSADIRVQLPEDSKRFDAIDADWKDLMRVAVDLPNAVEACNLEGRLERLEKMLEGLQMCEKALADYLETKRIAFPRFYFVAPGDLLDILSKGSSPFPIMKHLSKCFDNTHNLEFQKDKDGVVSKTAIGMYSGEKEYVGWHTGFTCDGAVEIWLAGLLAHIQASLKWLLKEATGLYDEKPREKWLLDHCAQIVVTVTRIIYTQDVFECFDQMEEGNEGALKEYWKKCQDQLDELVKLTCMDLSKGDRRKVITLCTIDTHARDVVQKLIDDRVDNPMCFQWQSQLRYSLDEASKACKTSICDFDFLYAYEYVGNCGCLVITPLTDRCYITLTQAQRLVLGGAPAGPAGTGKTETVKDLGRALGVMVYVFNCSDQMDYRIMGGIYKGLAQSGTWGCFDEFNRIPVEVLSVCSTQYKTVLDAIRAKKDRFVFEDEEIQIKRSVCAFITMNPGYAGRAELPESLKALFRPVSMCVPDLNLISEIMLLGEGFQMSKVLARKFIILYTLCQDLLSKQFHYDWKLRAIKTTLNVAGGMKRDAPDMSEDKVLLRALRDFNIGKLVNDDVHVFMGLLNDLFPKTLELVPRAQNLAFEEDVAKATRDAGLQPEPKFVLKITQLRELLEVRWSVFVLGPAGCGKSTVWRMLAAAQNRRGEKTVCKPMNPKSVTRNELYGFLHPQTREWKEGLISVTFRDMANTANVPHQWIIFDGDIDAEWIESMNTVMDDNKMLTLASNERIPLTPSMRLLFEIYTMKQASPATVSRGGVIYLNANDIGWEPFVETWIENRDDKNERGVLTELFGRYMEKSLEYIRRNFKQIIPLVEINMVSTVCYVLEALLDNNANSGAGGGGGKPAAIDKKLYEHFFVFACLWGLGGALLTDKTKDYRIEFSNWWRAEWRNVSFPDKGLVFDFYVNAEVPEFQPWSDKVEPFVYFADGNFSSIFVPTVDTTRLLYLLSGLVERKHACMFVGNAGTGKTMIMKEKLRVLDTEAIIFSTLNLNSFTTAEEMQNIMEQTLEKKSGVRYGPPGAKKLIYFVDDLNMPFVDKYDTQAPLELLRQGIDYHGWYDKVKIVMKEVLNTQLLACMNPTAGSFTINPRLQRHFATFAVQMPSHEQLNAIYSAICTGHLANFEGEVSRLGGKAAQATVELHTHVSNTFVPTAIKFHYQFNLRDLSNIVQGICRAVKEFYANPVKLVRLWVHECERVFCDRMVNEADMTRFGEMLDVVRKKYFEEVDAEAVDARPLIFTTFSQSNAEDVPVYVGTDSYAKLKKLLEDKLAEYNDTNATMELVLFEQAMEHVCRITRVIDLPRGNAMLVGVGGSGKQSLARLASFICGFEVFQITVTSSYSVPDFKNDLVLLYNRAGVKSIPMVFLMTDTQIIDERFLVYLNDLLSSGFIPDLFTNEDKDGICNSVRNEVKQAGIMDTRDNCWDFFIEKVRKYLHVVLCFSPVGDKFRVRARQFPALINNTVIDWFHGWPQEALVSVAGRFLADIPNIPDEVRENMTHHMAFVHMAVKDASQGYLEVERRYNYTTPKSFLELISLYKSLLHARRTNLRQQRERLESGLDKIAQASAQVADLQANLKIEQVIVEEKKQATDALIVSIGQEKAIVDEQKSGAAADEEECAAIAAEVSAFQAECQKDLAAAEPIIAEAEAALNSLDKKSLGELKSFGSPAAEVVQVGSACMVLTAPGGKIPKDLSWNQAKKMMGNVDQFLSFLRDKFDKDNVPVQCVEKVEKDFMSNPNFNPEYIKSKSAAAAGLCGWVVNICKYFRIYQVVAPKREKLLEANKKLENANSRLSGVRARVAELEARVRQLEEGLMRATEDKNAAIATAEKTKTKVDLADRLVNGLSGENKRWNESIELFGIMEEKLTGDVMLASSFVSYAGPFNARFRTALVSEKWIPDLEERQIPMTEGIQPLTMLSNDTEQAKWANEGLPSDSLSLENGAIITNCARWPLMIDPQLQGIQWIKNKEGPHGLKIIQLSQHKYIDIVENCIANGIPILVENLSENIDAVLDPVLSRSVIKRGRSTLMKLGDKEVEYDPNFRMYLHTKLSNPHYKPEIAAQTTLINFSVTTKGLEDQLLALVVNKERADLEETRQGLVRQLNEFKITLKDLEDNLLFRLSNSQGDILEDIELIENLEETKRTSIDIEQKVIAAKETEVGIAQAREAYRPVATRGSLLYFLIDRLNVLNHMYQYSMANFVDILKKGMDVAEPADDLHKRVLNLIASSSFVIFKYISQGLFERHKLIFAAQLTISIMRQQGTLDMPMFEFLLQAPKAVGQDNPMPEWMSNSVWSSVQALKDIEEFHTLPDDIIGSAKRWRDWIELERPEDEPLPGDWKKLPEFQQLLIMRALRGDRMTSSVTKFVKSVMGVNYVTSYPFNLKASFADSRPGVPMFIFLSPGVDAAGAVEKMGEGMGFSYEAGNYASVSLGQGQEEPAIRALMHAHKNGGWVLLQNIHLTPRWTAGPLEKAVDKLAEGAHEQFRLFLSAEPSPDIPINVLQNSIKLTNEPPEGVKPNLLRAMNNFSDEYYETCAKIGEFKSIVFALSYFHSVLLERKKFGPQGWNMNYPFNTGDLVNCAQCAANYLEGNAKVPWDDLRYIFGEIMYGGHVVDDWDRRTVSAYLISYMKEELIEGMDLYPRFHTPPNSLTHPQMLQYVEDNIGGESPVMFGLHPNAEIGYRLLQTDSLFKSVQSLQPRSSAGGSGLSIQDKAKTLLDDVLEKIPEDFNMEDITSRVEERTPYTVVFLQEIERMNGLLFEVRRSLIELDLGLKGDLTISDAMEQLMLALSLDNVPKTWENMAYPSLRPLGSWVANLLERIKQLTDWTADMALPKATWLPGLFNPQSFLTAVMQTTARRNDWPLDKTVVLTEVTKKQLDGVDAPSREGAFIHGMVLEGCGWDDKGGVLADSRPKELFVNMPVILIRAVTVDKAEQRDSYMCPVYKTAKRGPSYVFTAQLRSKVSQVKWILAGVAMLMEVT